MEHSWRFVAYFGFGERRKKKCRKTQEDSEIISYNGFYLQVPSCMYDVFGSFGMVYACGYLVMICHWHGGLPGLTVVFPSLSIC